MAIQIHDEAGLLGPGDLSVLQTASGRWPFEVHILTSTSSSNRGAFEARVSAAVTGPNVVSIGLDPTHHMTIVHFGKETGVPASQWSAIYSAGNSEFKESHWVDGLTRIGDRAFSAKQQAETVTIQPDRPAGSTDHTGAWVFGGLVAVACIIGLYYWWRAKKQTEERERQLELENEALAEKQARNREEAAWGDKYREKVSDDDAPSPPRRRASSGRSAYQQPAPAPAPVYVASPAPAPSTVVVNQTSGGGGSGDLLTGYMIGSMSHQPIVREREIVREVDVVHDRDSGGGSSSWGSSSNSNDSGGGGSSWSNDSGGGGSSYEPAPAYEPPAPTYSPPSTSYDSGPSYDSGGGGGGFDSGGGGGFDSGGGGGDW